MGREIWRQIRGFEGVYEVSSKGKVRGIDRLVYAGHGVMRKCPGKRRRLQYDYGLNAFLSLYNQGYKGEWYVDNLVRSHFMVVRPQKMASPVQIDDLARMSCYEAYKCHAILGLPYFKQEEYLKDRYELERR